MKITKLLINFTRKIVHLLWLKNSGYIYSAIIIPLNPLTPKIADFLTHFCPLLTKRKREYIMSKPCIHNVFGSPLSSYEVKITLSCTGKPICRILFEKVPKIWNYFFYYFFFQMDKAYWSTLREMLLVVLTKRSQLYVFS